NFSLSCSKPCNRHPERRTAHVVHSDVVEELHRCRISSVLSAHSELDVRLDRVCLLHRQLHQLSDSVLVYGHERIGLQVVVVHVHLEELGRVVTTVSEGHLCQIVGSEREELGLARYLVCDQGSPWNLNHSSYHVVQL